MIKVLNVGSRILPNYILMTPKGIIVIDTGFPGGADMFFKRLEKKANPKDVRYLFLTHAHSDHVGYAKEIVERTHAEIVAHELAVPYISSGQGLKPLKGGYTSKRAKFIGRMLHKLVSSKSGFPPVHFCSSDIVISDESNQPFIDIGIRVVYLPGHTMDQIGLYIEESRELFCGDAAMDTILNVRQHPIWMEDKEAFGSTWDYIIKLNPSLIYPAHGSPICVSALKKNRHYFDNRKVLSHDF